MIFSRKSVAVLLLSGCWLQACDKEQESLELPLRPVKYQAVQFSDNKTVKTFSGVTKAELEAALSFRVAGRVEKIPVNVGDRLEQGRLVARLDDNDYLVLLEQAKAELAAAKASLRSAESEYNRTIGLYEKRNASKSQLDTSRAQSESAAAQVKALQQQLEAARLQLSYTNLYAPRNCIVFEKPVKENENVSAGQVVVNVNCGSKIEVQVAVPETYIDSVQAEQIVTVRVNAIPDTKFTGVVTEISSGSSDQVAAFPVTIVLKEKHASLRAGLAAEVDFQHNEEASERFFLLPVTAVGNDEQGDFAFILKSTAEEQVGTIQKKYIHIDALVEEGVRVSNGLAVGDRVVIAGLTFIRDGMQVKIE